MHRQFTTTQNPSAAASLPNYFSHLEKVTKVTAVTSSANEDPWGVGR
jgi:hypothetical protein